ncbi:hypothetical protein B0H14DRAFT_3716288 [Mycena olivaceomarginata]|nr:hypothetical protein B0H14DRAFT_3716288 [Mycena olivaceomarginata]
MPNPTGKNGAGEKNYPPDEVLRETLLKYVRSGLKQAQKLDWLVKDHNLSIGTTKLNQIETQLKIPSVRKNPAPREVAVQAVADELDKDVMQNNGPNFIKSKLKDNLVIVKRNLNRDDVRQLMREWQPLGAENRYPGHKKNKIYRHPVSALGPFHEVSLDGHEKLGKQALKMGDVGLLIYRWKDKWTAYLLKLAVVPKCRTNAAIGHLFLDFLKEIEGLLTHSCWLKALQTALRLGDQFKTSEQHAPDIDLAVYPGTRAFWRWLREKLGVNLRDHILRGKTDRICDPKVAFHCDLFNWIFPPLVQAELDEFRTYWHLVRSQPNKNMPSGHVPADALEHPEVFGGINCLIKVPKETLANLRVFLTEEVGPRSEHLQWVDDEFAAIAEAVYKSIGSPHITLTNSWEIFRKMSARIENLGNNVA